MSEEPESGLHDKMLIISGRSDGNGPHLLNDKGLYPDSDRSDRMNKRSPTTAATVNLKKFGNFKNNK
jgi:hypothetical protein